MFTQLAIAKPHEPSSLHLPVANSPVEAILESWLDGILILNSQGEWIYANHCAHQLCAQLNPTPYQPKQTPAQLWQVCQELVAQHQACPQSVAFIEFAIDHPGFIAWRVRVQWLNVHNHKPYFLISLENRHQALQSLVYSERQQYHLTKREAEVWLLRRAGYSYQEIARQSCITINTVKQHLKRVYAKRHASLVDNDNE